MNEIMTFNSEEFGQVRTLAGEQGQALFCAMDVCRALGYSHPPSAISRHVEQDDVSKRHIVDSRDRKNHALFINESGLYALILSSRLEGARRFKYWVTSEVLPAIRRDGGYMAAPAEEETDEMVMARAFRIMERALEQRDEQIAQLLPRAAYADEVLDAEGCYTTTQVAKELEMSAIELNRRLVEAGIQYHQSGQYLLYAEYARRGYARNRTLAFRAAPGRLRSQTYLVWTERGRRFIHQIMRN